MAPAQNTCVSNSGPVGKRRGKTGCLQNSKSALSTPEDGISLLVNYLGASTMQADPDIESISVPAVKTTSVDTLPPRVLSIMSQDPTTPSRTHADGDPLLFEVTFDNPVEVSICWVNV